MRVTPGCVYPMASAAAVRLPLSAASSTASHFEVSMASSML